MPSKFAETIGRIERSNPAVVTEWREADQEAQQCGLLLAGCMGAKSETDALNIGRKLRSEVVRVAMRIFRARRALVEAEKTASKIVLPVSMVLTSEEQGEVMVMGTSVRKAVLEVAVNAEENDDPDAGER